MSKRQNQGQLSHPVSPETRKKISKALRGRKSYERTPEHREKMRQIMQRPETRRKLRQASIRWFANPEVREKCRQAALKQWASPGFREKMRRIYMRPDVREGHRQATLRRMASPEMRERARRARLRQTFPKKMTEIEQSLRDEFRKRRLRFEMHKTMFGRFQPDFVFEEARLIVQADGDYWHSLPKRRANDRAFAKAALLEGWSVWRFGEREIQMHAPACARAVARFVRDHQC